MARAVRLYNRLPYEVLRASLQESSCPKNSSVEILIYISYSRPLYGSDPKFTEVKGSLSIDGNGLSTVPLGSLIKA